MAKDDELRTLVDDFMREEHCSEDTAVQIIGLATHFLVVTGDASALLDRLPAIEAQLGAAGLRMSRARLVSMLYLFGTICLTPAGNTACATILWNTSAPAPTTTSPSLH